MAGKFMKAPADAALAAKGAAKGRRAQKRSASPASGLERFRRFTSPSGLTVRASLTSPPPLATSPRPVVTKSFRSSKRHHGKFSGAVLSCSLIVDFSHAQLQLHGLKTLCFRG